MGNYSLNMVLRLTLILSWVVLPHGVRSALSFRTSGPFVLALADTSSSSIKPGKCIPMLRA